MRIINERNGYPDESMLFVVIPELVIAHADLITVDLIIGKQTGLVPVKHQLLAFFP